MDMVLHILRTGVASALWAIGGLLLTLLLVSFFTHNPATPEHNAAHVEKVLDGLMVAALLLIAASLVGGGLG